MLRLKPNPKPFVFTIAVLLLGIIMAVACQSNDAVDLLDGTREPEQSHDHADAEFT